MKVLRIWAIAALVPASAAAEEFAGANAEAAMIAPGDRLSIVIYRSPDLSGDYQVDEDGLLAMPLVGEIAASGLTTMELDEQLTRRLGADFLERPDVRVAIRSSTRRSVTVDGSVRQSGSFPVDGPMSLMQAVALAGGLAEDANPRRTAIFRTVNGRRHAAAFDLARIRRGQAPDPPVRPGDIVIVDGSSTSATQRQIMNSLPLLSIFRPF